VREWQTACIDPLRVSSVDLHNRDSEQGWIGHAGLLRVGFNAFEFVFHFEDFNVPGVANTGPLVMVISPALAQAFAATLAESLAEYEKRFGRIPEAPKRRHSAKG
jgi:hypothetical protein